MLSKVIETLKNSSSVAIYAHINVDCDAMGSCLALKNALNQLGKEVDVFINSDFPSNFDFYGDLSFINKKTVKEKYDLAVCLDSLSDQRLGRYRYTFNHGVKNTLLIDHHMANTKYCKINYVVQASSTSEILFDVLKGLNIEFTKDICKFLISGIATDTGRFSYSANAKTMSVVSKLLEIGNLSMAEISAPLFNSMTDEVFELTKIAYSKVEFYANKKLAVLIFKYSDFVETGTKLTDVDSFPDIFLGLKSVQFGILASEDDKGYFRVSFRSKGELSAKAVAETFGGGGHLNASGCKLFGEYETVKQRLIDSTLSVLGWKNE